MMTSIRSLLPFLRAKIAYNLNRRLSVKTKNPLWLCILNHDGHHSYFLVVYAEQTSLYPMFAHTYLLNIFSGIYRYSSTIIHNYSFNLRFSMAIYNHPLLCTISILLQEPTHNPTSLRFYSMRISEQELYHVLSQPATMKILKQAVHSEFSCQQKNKTYASLFYDVQELIVETQLELMKNICKRKGLLIHEEHTNLSGWLFLTFKNACRDVMRRKNIEGSREVASFVSSDKKDCYSIGNVTSPSHSCFSLHYEQQLHTTIKSLAPKVVLRTQTVITPIRSLCFLLLHHPSQVTFEDFSHANNYTRTIESIWSIWNTHRDAYDKIQEGDTALKLRSRRFLVWLLRGEDFSSPADFEEKRPKEFKQARDTLRQTVNRAQEDLMCITIVRAAASEQVHDTLFATIVRKAAPFLISYRGMIEPFVREVCTHRFDHTILARLLFSTYSSLTARKEDSRSSAQSRFQYVQSKEKSS